MRLRRFEIRNFKAIAEAALEWEELLVLIGENNAGKSSVLAALAVFLSGGAIRDASLFRRHLTDADNAIELTGYFDELSPQMRQQAAVRGRLHNGEWILKKRYWLEPGGQAEDAERAGWKEQLFTYSSRDDFVDWPQADNTWGAFPEVYQAAIADIPDRGARPTNAAREALKALVRVRRPDLVVQTPPEWVPNPGGGGNWKSNANSIVPRVIFVRAVHEASDETGARDASTYGKLINLIIERQLSQRPEMLALQAALDAVFGLFRPDEQRPERQAREIQTLQARINEGLADVIGGQALIRTEPPELRSLVMPNTSLVVRDPLAGIDTEVGHQGHGLQRTMVMTLLQLLSEAQAAQPGDGENAILRSTILLVEEPELYLHPQMERLMRDVLYRLSAQANIQVACCTHSPVFLDIGERCKSIVRMTRTPDGDVSSHQVTRDIFPGAGARPEREKLQTIARFHPTVNELFFAKQVILFEEASAISAFERCAELTGLFLRHRRLKREVALVDCDGKNNITAFQRVLNEFNIPYRVLHDEDSHNPAAFAENARILAALQPGRGNIIHMMSPRDLEGQLGYVASKGMSKPFAAVKKVEELHAAGILPNTFIEAMNMVYFGLLAEPAP
ncbi:ATP-dependent nuclease [Burkholderia gladioli]|uniref:ATP-dependent nuclease n=1 Tax=Burkholderia gladioli TaxID=28095 RepID=UPI00163EFE70|nr:AAA family ATPase [Burkholderia gladioli]